MVQVYVPGSRSTAPAEPSPVAGLVAPLATTLRAESTHSIVDSVPPSAGATWLSTVTLMLVFGVFSTTIDSPSPSPQYDTLFTSTSGIGEATKPGGTVSVTE